jgi:type VI secretion system secreted protein VgrG
MAGGSQIIINKNGITIITPAKFEVKAGQHLFKSGAEVGVDIQGLPSYEAYNEKFKILTPSGEEMSNIEYKVSSNDQKFTAITDRKGFSKRVNTTSEQNLEVDLNWISLEKADEEG